MEIPQRPIVIIDDSQKEVIITNLDYAPSLPLSLYDGNIDASKDAVIRTETEVSTPNSEVEVSEDITKPLHHNKTIQLAFQDSQSHWIDDPVVNQWRDHKHRIHQVLSEVNDLHHAWTSARASPFSSSANALYRQIGRLLADVGLPWHNNQINMPDEIDTSWSFHFKSFELEVLRAKGARVGDAAASGYVCNSTEANLYCIRALQQELREKHPPNRPILMFDHFDIKLLKSAEVFFGLELHHATLSSNKEDLVRDLQNATAHGTRPIIFAATLWTANGEADDMERICEISSLFPLILHVDATRNFDYITTISESERHQLAIPKFTLGVKSLGRPLKLPDRSMIASTIVAGGLNVDASAPTVALKPSSLGGKHVRVAYTRASDSTLAGSRDAVAILWLALQEFQFGKSGYREKYRCCVEARNELVRALQSVGVSTAVPPYAPDVIIKSCSAEQKERLGRIGGTLTDKGHVILLFQPGVVQEDVGSVTSIMSSTYPQLYSIRDTPHTYKQTSYTIPQYIIDKLRTTVESWKIATRSAAGYPFHMGSLSALGPVIGRFLDTTIPRDWVQARSNEILAARMKEFSLQDPQDQQGFQGAFTNGSTMGNRVGIHVALAHFPGAFVYFSSESHYSVAKTLRDCDKLTNRWETADHSSGRGPRYAQIPCDVDGSISIDALACQAVTDRSLCVERGDDYNMVLFANMGTTFVGARDNLIQIQAALSEVEIGISYIHVDGALDFGFDSCDIALGPPGLKPGLEGLPSVQGITLSHHKAMGGTVSGEVLCYSPRGELAELVSPAEPRVVFETWLYSQVYTPSDLAVMLRCCRANAARLTHGLKGLGVATKTISQAKQGQRRDDGNEQEPLIVVLERPPAWITEEFSLRPEGDWVHFIPMPHISPETVDFFVERIAAVDRQCSLAFSYVVPLLSAVFMRLVTLNRIHCRSSQAEEIATQAQSAMRLDPVAACDQSLDVILKACLRGAISIAVTDYDEQIQAAFLVESLRDMSIRVGPILLASCHHGKSGEATDIAKQLMGFIARHMHAKLRTDEDSYSIYLF